jgi:hypothetical protein
MLTTRPLKNKGITPRIHKGRARVFIFSIAQQSLVGQDLLITAASRLHSDTPHSVDSSGRVIGPTQIPLPDNTQPKETDIHAVGIFEPAITLN